LRLLINRMGVRGLDRLIAEFVPDAIVCTHFLPLNLLARERRAGDLPVPLYGVVTDYTGHAYWVYPGVDGYFVATPETAAMLARRGAPAAAIAVTGIPIDPAIAAPKDPAAIRAARDLDRPPVVTLMGGGVSVESVRAIVTGLLARGLTGTLVVVAGRNKAVQSGLSDLGGNERLTLRVLGFVDYVDDLAAASDLVVTKAGGLIVSELLARGTPMALVEPIPGQEEWNADYVVGVGAGIQLRLAEMAAPAVQHLLETPGWLPLLREGAARAGRPRAALAVAGAVLDAITAPAAPAGARRA
jgi:processive 1,2-diacylglycerol beta-glucosyltransferase